MSGGHSTGSGGGTSSSRSQFRSQTGCCICGTKSSSSRFTISTRYSEHFAGCFGQQAAARSGDLCNACVLCVKRWLQRDRQTGLFAQVLDSKKGPGPKHMKEITKRARRREARKANAMKAASVKADPGSNVNTNNSTSSTPVNRGSTSTHSGPSFATRSTSNATASNGITSGGAAHRGPSSMNDSSRFLSSRHGAGCNTNNSYVHSASGHHPSAGESARSTSRSGCQWSGRTNAVQTSGHPTMPCCTQHQRMYFSPQPTGATFTRAAAAAIRKCEARCKLLLFVSKFHVISTMGRFLFNCLPRHTVIQSTGNALSCSTPSRGGVCGACTGTKRTPNTSSTPSETSEYGSGLISLSCCSTSSGSHCPMVGGTSSSCCSNSSCGAASSGIGCGLNYSPPCCAFCCTGSDATPSKHGKYELDRSCLCRGCPCVGHQSLCHAASSMDCCMAPPEFRHPRPPPGSSSNGVGRNGAADPLHAADNGNNSNSGSSSSVSTPPNSTPTRRYNRRVVLPPVRMSHNEEVNSLLREIMERHFDDQHDMVNTSHLIPRFLLTSFAFRNSQAITFDSREMHMAVQKELRLRSRTVQGNSTSDSVSGRASSISSADGSADARTSSSTHAMATCPSKVPVSGATEQHSSEHFTKRHRAHHCCARYHTHCCHLRHLPCVCSSNSHQHRKV
ncbi:hypothetical protein T265_11362 [Opisthorchis viverrini]|uniref:Protein FAM60A n=1 Tax=Opisthorchis viverrini TaxID=6198 RepID=A0A074Z9S5_OPIVI|nr:hypothetical protein T265_11362 [Opisthorchis viverrini]KER19995.1 hypothetical protein T265_11362 [Opisthorchis viverrini]